MDENGDAILFEGECRKKEVKEEVCYNYVNMSAIVGMMCVFIPMGIYCGKAAAQSWSLYLTKSAVHYLFQGPYNCDRKNWDIPLTDIKGISVPDQHAIVIEMERACVYRYVGRPWLGRGSTSITLTHCDNAREFVEAVKQQMEHTQINN